MHLEQVSYIGKDYGGNETNLCNVLFQRMLPDSKINDPAAMPEYWEQHVLDALMKHGYQSCTHVSIEDAFTDAGGGEDDSKPVEPRLLNPKTRIAVFFRNGLKNQLAIQWLERVGEIIEAVMVMRGQFLETHEPLNDFLSKTRSMAPIRLTEFDDTLVFADPIGIDGERIHSMSKLGTLYLGRHEVCGGWIIRRNRSKTHDVLTCVSHLSNHGPQHVPLSLSLCGLCVPIPSSLVFYEDLLRHLQKSRLVSDSLLLL